FKSIGVLLAIVITLVPISSEALCLNPPSRDVFVYRNITSDSAPVKVHCFSGDDDFGDHMLYGKQYFKFSFCPNYFPTTEFFCHLWWGNKEKGFVAFKQKTFKNYDSTIWLAKDDGIYMTHYES
ncbi:hypothetical protein M569_01930, partial [Genlisea aurea]